MYAISSSVMQRLLRFRPWTKSVTEPPLQSCLAQRREENRVGSVFIYSLISLCASKWRTYLHDEPELVLFAADGLLQVNAVEGRYVRVDAQIAQDQVLLFDFFNVVGDTFDHLYGYFVACTPNQIITLSRSFHARLFLIYVQVLFVCFLTNVTREKNVKNSSFLGKMIFFSLRR